MRKSLKQIIDTIETFANSHKGIKQFEAKPLSEFTADGYLFPLMWVQLTGITYETGQAKIKMSIYFVDKLKADYDNFIKVVSDTLKLCDDTYTWFTDNEEEFGFYTSNDAGIVPVEYAFDDNVAGNKMDLVIQVCLNRNEDEVPI